MSLSKSGLSSGSLASLGSLQIILGLVLLVLISGGGPPI
jgi:hypothetical protein